MSTGVSQIVILSQPIRSGKTTSLLHHISLSNARFDGVVCPDLSGSRKLMLIHDRRIVDLETSVVDGSIAVGRFYFKQSAFDSGNQLLKSLSADVHSLNSDIIIDEVGKLELNNSGFHDGLSSVLRRFSLTDKIVPFNLLLVVRDSLLDQVIEKYQLQNALISTVDQFFSNRMMKSDVKAAGLILCGGQSSRMGRNKAFIEYHNMPQYKFLSLQLDELGMNSFISCRKDQSGSFNENDEMVLDDDEFSDAGPMTGLLSAFKSIKEQSLLVLGCDYPLISTEHLNRLLAFKNFNFPAVCFVRKNRPDSCEPLVAFYHHSCGNLLLDYYHAGNRSLSKFLSSLNAIKIELDDDAFLKSFDSPNDFRSF